MSVLTAWRGVLNEWEGQITCAPWGHPPTQSQASEGLAVAKSLQGDPGKIRGAQKPSLPKPCLQSFRPLVCRKDRLEGGFTASGLPGSLQEEFPPPEQQKEAARRNRNAPSLGADIFSPVEGYTSSLVSISFLSQLLAKLKHYYSALL